MTDQLRICHDRIAPRDAGRPLNTITLPGTRGPQGGGGPSRAVLPDARVMWPNGTTLRVGFLEGDSTQQDQVRQFAPQWTEHANLTFEFGDVASADIRIAFDSSDGAWSYLGDRAKDIAPGMPTMNLGWVDEAVILHEFGHALGLGHEHQNPEGGIEWNEEAVIRDLSGPPNNWSEAQIRHNVLDKYSVNHYLRGTEFDPDSIMLYFFPSSWTKSGQSTTQNLVLSMLDTQFIGSDQGYPKSTTTTETLPVAEVTPVHASLTSPGQEHLYHVDVTQAGEHVFETSGTTDVVMSLYGPDNDTAKIAEDDDSGRGRNARIARYLGTGRYLVQVRHYNTVTGLGDYSVDVLRRG